MIGLIGLAIVTYFYLETMQEYNELEEMQQMTMLYTMSDNTRAILFILEAVGAVAGFWAYRKWKAKIGLLGMGLCALNLILLFYPF